MTTELKNIFLKLFKLPVEEQNAIADLLKKELTFVKTNKKLAVLASEAIEEHKQGKTKRLTL